MSRLYSPFNFSDLSEKEQPKFSDLLKHGCLPIVVRPVYKVWLIGKNFSDKIFFTSLPSNTFLINLVNGRNLLSNVRETTEKYSTKIRLYNPD